MFRIITLFFCINLTLNVWTEINKENQSYNIYTSEEMRSHKEKCKMMMVSNLLNHKDDTYQMQRALLTISGNDADYIPKVVGAGEIFNNEGVIPYQLMHNGVKIVLNSYYDTQWLTDVIYGLKGHHEPQEEKCFYEILKYIPEEGTMIELGSYWAYYSLWFSSEIKGAKNYLIEPDPRRLAIGVQNFKLNNKVGIFHRGFLGVVKDSDPDIIGAEYISIDDFIEKEGIEHVNILHADIQGAESEMLVSCIKHLNKIDYFIISTHGDQSDHLFCLQFLQSNGFIIIAQHTASESCSGDGLVVARRRDVRGPDQISIRKYRN